MNWTSYDEKLIRRGEILFDLDFLDRYNCELDSMNRDKTDRPFALTDGYIEFLSVVRYLFNMPYRQLEGFTRSLNRLVPALPSVDYSYIRKRSLNLDLDLHSVLKHSNTPIEIAVDSSGIKVHRSGAGLNANTERRNVISRYISL
ncbi:MAG: transposase [Methanotrichaceae archaeon]